MPNLNDWITRLSLKDYAGTAIFQRGEVYFNQGAVHGLFDTGDKITARVYGTEVYQVKLSTDGKKFNYECSCPHAEEGYFCKHCVAVGLAFLAERQQGHTSGFSGNEAGETILAYLKQQSIETLMNWLLDAAHNDDALYRKLLLKAQQAVGTGDLGKTFRAEIDKAIYIDDFIDYYAADNFADDLEKLLDALEELQTPESAASLVELTEYAIEKLDEALQRVDDSDGGVGGVLERLQMLHLEACKIAKPDPVALAERLFRYETTQDFDAFYNSLNKYHDVLGEAGLQCFRELAEKAWKALPPLQPNESAYIGNRWRITQIMESLAKLSGDIEALVAIKSKDLTGAYRYLEIAKIYQDAKQEDKALDWAEHGLKIFAHQPDNRLRDFLVDIYLHNARQDEALELTWRQFEESPRLDYYQKLHSVAEPLGAWPVQRERALSLLESKAAEPVYLPPYRQSEPLKPNYSVRVEIALWEQDYETAWQAVQNGACRQELKLTLAERLASTHPERALALYRPAITAFVEQTNNKAYDQAIHLIRKVVPLMNPNEFRAYLAELRVKYKLKRNFMALLDKLDKSKGF